VTHHAPAGRQPIRARVEYNRDSSV